MQQCKRIYCHIEGLTWHSEQQSGTGVLLSCTSVCVLLLQCTHTLVMYTMLCSLLGVIKGMFPFQLSHPDSLHHINSHSSFSYHTALHLIFFSLNCKFPTDCYLPIWYSCTYLNISIWIFLHPQTPQEVIVNNSANTKWPLPVCLPHCDYFETLISAPFPSYSITL